MRCQVWATAAATLIVASGCAREATGIPRAAGSSSPSASAMADCSSVSPAPQSTFKPPPTTDPSFWTAQANLDDLAAKITRFGARFPQAYAGLALETEYGRLAVYRVPSAPFDTALRAEFPAAPLRLVNAAHSARELANLRDRVLGDEAYWKRKGVALNALSPLNDGSCLQVGTSKPDRARPLFRERYGPAPIQLIHSEPAHGA
jgi:hypothetical protein